MSQITSMQFQVFQFSLPVESADLGELNQFLEKHRTTSVTQSIVTRSGEPMLLFVIEYLKSTEKPATQAAAPARKPLEDFQARLGDQGYAIFNRLRDQRKEIADRKGVKIYNVFNNAQLAEMIEQKMRTMEELATIDGVGKAKLERFGAAFVQSLSREFHENQSAVAVPEPPEADPEGDDS